MAVSEEDILRDTNERNSLQRAISDLETAIAVSNPGTRRILENTLENAKKRVAVLDRRIEEAKVEHEGAEQARIAAATALAAKETALNARERKEYAGFLKEEFFTKREFGKLEHFYSHSYDRLSEDGKEEMSKRIHEGIKRGEFKFTDLPHNIQEKDDEHCSAKANKDAPAHAQVNRSKAAFSHPTEHAEATAMKDVDLGSVDLSGIKLIVAGGSPTTATLPNASDPKSNQR